MSNPQQPELRRSGHTQVAQDHAAEVAGRKPAARPRRRTAPGPVPPDNEPGHHPEHEQDKPADPTRPPTAEHEPRKPTEEGTQRFPFQFDARLVPLALPFGVLPSTAYVDVDRGDDEGQMHIRFGPWSLRTPLANVAEVTPTGPYQWWKVAGPPHLSLADRGITFATTTAGGLCVRFREAVPAVVPTSVLRHPAATVTVASPTALAEAISPSGNGNQ